MPNMNKLTAAANVGNEPLVLARPGAGRTQICHGITGEQAATEVQIDILKRGRKRLERIEHDRARQQTIGTSSGRLLRRNRLEEQELADNRRCHVEHDHGDGKGKLMMRTRRMRARQVIE